MHTRLLAFLAVTVLPPFLLNGQDESETLVELVEEHFGRFSSPITAWDKDLKWQDMVIARTADTVKRKKVVHYLIIILSHIPVMRPLGPKGISSH